MSSQGCHAPSNRLVFNPSLKMASLLHRLSKSSSLRQEVASLLHRGLSGAGSPHRIPGVNTHRVGRRTRARLLAAALSGGQQHLAQPSTNGETAWAGPQNRTRHIQWGY